MSNQDVIESYKQNFQSPLGAYAYMVLNQKTPEFFVISSHKDSPLSEQMEQILRTTTNQTELEFKIQNLPDGLFDELQKNSAGENDISKKTLLKTITNLKYMEQTEDWENLNGIIDYNGFSKFVSDKISIKEKLQKLCGEYSLKDVSINPNFNPTQFLQDFREGTNIMCETLGISPTQIGLGTLSLNYRTEEGNFTGYMDKRGNDKCLNYMVINKTSVFAHEWMHFVESSLGFKGHSLTTIAEQCSENFKQMSILSDVSEIGNFTTSLKEKIQEPSTTNFSQAVISVSHFFERYAIDKNSFQNNVGQLAQQFSNGVKNKEDTSLLFSTFETSMATLLTDNYPARYFSFLKAQCELHAEQEQQTTLQKNQLIDFAQKADKHLGEDDYTASTVEMFARTFESFVYRKANNSKCTVVASTYDSDLYPQGKMQDQMDTLWEKMWEQIKNKIHALSPTEETQINDKKSFILTNIQELRQQYDNISQNKTTKCSA